MRARQVDGVAAKRLRKVDGAIGAPQRPDDPLANERARRGQVVELVVVEADHEGRAADAPEQPARQRRRVRQYHVGRGEACRQRGRGGPSEETAFEGVPGASQEARHARVARMGHNHRPVALLVGDAYAGQPAPR